MSGRKPICAECGAEFVRKHDKHSFCSRCIAPKVCECPTPITDLDTGLGTCVWCGGRVPVQPDRPVGGEPTRPKMKRGVGQLQ
jgi:hypothetical protein